MARNHETLFFGGETEVRMETFQSMITFTDQDAWSTSPFYEFALSYDRVAMSFQRMWNTDHHDMPILQDDEMGFQNYHPGRRYCYLRKSKTIKIPKLSMPKGMICDLEELELDEVIPRDKVIENRTNYAKVALVLFCPF